MEPLSVAEELAEALWQEGSQGAVGLYQCPGRYVLPSMPFPLDSDSTTFPLVVVADAVASREPRVVADGNVEVRQGNRRLRAGSATRDETAFKVRASGDVRFDEPGLSVHGAEASLDLDSPQAMVEHAEFVLTDLQLRGRADRIARRGEVVELDTTTVTSCPPGDVRWQIRAQSIRLDAATEVATSRHARLQLGGVPVFYAPYLRFPVSDRRSSGFLVPDVYEGRDGIDVSVPYYINLAPNYDATLTPRWIAERGLGVEGEVRHRSRWTDTEFDAAFLSGDRDYDGEFARTDAGNAPGGFSPSDRWSLDIDHRGRLGDFVTAFDVAAVSDNDYFRDFALEEGVASRVALERRGEVEYRRGALVARLLAQGFQRLESGPQSYRRLPEIGVSYAGLLVGPLGWSMGATWASFDSSANAVTGDRYHLDPRLRLALNRPWGFVKVSGGVRRTGYDLANAPAGNDPRPRRRVAIGVLDAGLFLERDVSLASGAGALLGARSQTLEPRLYYLRQSYADQDALPRFDATELTFSYRQLFRENRYAGLDRIGDANRLSIGVASRLLDATGAEVLGARLGALVHLEDPRVRLGSTVRPHPDLVGELAGQLGPVRIVSRLSWDAGGDELGEFGTGLAYRRDARRIVNIAYRRRFPDIDQTDVSVHWPVPGSDRVSVFGRWNHDWRHGQIVESFAGLSYGGCCLAVKLLWHRTMDAPRNLPGSATTTESGLMLQLSFKGLGGFGSKVDSRLVRGIKGYRPAGG
ncbi:MAG: LPS-assembly protein LptD [Gammaproteobacteria bacterium]|nr:LPS-assembly protein LptD [Gammaproteobacteria bacterium]MDE0443307.1 LPS-assembly protein LptD [Gammaproteobacteria bacterium]